MRRVCYHAVAEVQKVENMCPRYVWHRRRPLAAGKKDRMWRVLQAVLPGEEQMLATNRTCGRRGPVLVLEVDFGGGGTGDRAVGHEGRSKFGGVARAQAGYQGVQKSGTAARRVLSLLQGGGIGCIQVVDEASAGTRSPRWVG